MRTGPSNGRTSEKPHLAVTVNIRLPDHLIHLLVGELLTEVSHHVSQLSSGDEAVAVLVEHLRDATSSAHRTQRSAR
jgi:hypothetical protein